MLFAIRPLGKMESPRPDTMIALLHALVEWSEEANVYRRGSQFLITLAAKQGNKMISAEVDTLAQWQEVWMLSPTRSVEGTIRFADRLPRRNPCDCCRWTTGPVRCPTRAQSADQLGPGAAYHASKTAKK